MSDLKMPKYVKKVWYDCPRCKEHVPEEEVFAEYRSVIGQYGAIVLASISCKCGFRLVHDEIVDNGGNIAPRSKH